MIVRRIAASAAGLALVGTALAAAPAMAKQNTTELTVDKAFATATSAVGIKISAVKPAKMKGSTLSFKASLKGKNITHKGGLQLALGSKFATIENIKLNYKTGKASADVNNTVTNSVIPVKNLLVFSGGKNKVAKNGTWKNAKVSLAKSVNITSPPLGKQDPAALIGTILGVPATTVANGAQLGKASIKVKLPE